MSDTRRRILDAARDIEREHGAERLTMRTIAGRVGVTATALYRHFRNKDALLRELRAEDARTFQAYLDRVLEHERPGHRLAYAGSAYLDFALDHPELYRTFFLSQPRTPLERNAVGTVRVRTYAFLRDRIDDCMRAGLVRDGDASQVAIEVWAQMHGLIALYMAGAVAGTADAFRDRYARAVDRLFASLSA
ncbi:MAG TPA: TetR/AcrR family transcriptional regulator [Longimicrobiales bacterium]